MVGGFKEVTVGVRVEHLFSGKKTFYFEEKTEKICKKHTHKVSIKFISMEDFFIATSLVILKNIEKMLLKYINRISMECKSTNDFFNLTYLVPGNTKIGTNSK